MKPPGRGRADGDAYHTVVIGAGPGGLTAAIGLARIGKRVALIEAGAVGGDCTNVGCIPSKALLHASLAVAAGRLSAREALQRARALRDQVRQEEARLLQAVPTLELVRGHGSLIGAHQVRVRAADGQERTLRARHVVVATGTKPIRPALAGLPTDRVLTNEELFEIPEPPAHLAIVGGGAIGAEMSLAFARLGSSVTLIEAAGSILAAFEPEASQLVTKRLRANGVRICVAARASSYDEPTRTLVLDDGERITGVDRVLLAIGRVPNSAGLGLESVGLELDRGALIGSYRTELRGLDRAITDDHQDGFLLVHAIRLSGRVLSATWVGPHAADLMPLLTLAVERRMSLYALSRLTFAYPSLSEAIKVIADQFLFDTLRHPARELGRYLANRWRRAASTGTRANASGEPAPRHEPADTGARPGRAG